MSVPVKHQCAKVSVKAYPLNTCTNFKMATCPELKSETESQHDFDTSSESQRSAKKKKKKKGVGGGGVLKR